MVVRCSVQEKLGPLKYGHQLYSDHFVMKTTLFVELWYELLRPPLFDDGTLSERESTAACLVA